jgi:hypothetical protein
VYALGESINQYSPFHSIHHHRQVIYELVDTKKRLRALNAQIVEEEGLARGDELLLLHSSTSMPGGGGRSAAGSNFDEAHSHKGGKEQIKSTCLIISLSFS